ncbi:MAG: ParB/RepB/Spo0J family partition protein [Acidobacteriota bacterium]
MKRQALGKGLDALLPQPPAPANTTALLELDLDRIHPNALQPRLVFEPEKLDDLAGSIAENGVIQPIVVRRSGGGYEIIAGERRWRAAQKAGLPRIPAIIQDVSDEKMLELALVENIQRDELSPIEEAHAYRLLIDQFGLTQEQVAQRVGRSRTAVANTLRLLQLPSEIQKDVVRGLLSMGHARALIPLPRKDQAQLAQQISHLGLSVRDTERRVKRLQRPPRPPASEKDPDVLAAERQLEERWKTRAEIQLRKGRGRIALYFDSQEDLDQLYQALMAGPPC